MTVRYVRLHSRAKEMADMSAVEMCLWSLSLLFSRFRILFLFSLNISVFGTFEFIGDMFNDVSARAFVNLDDKNFSNQDRKRGATLTRIFRRCIFGAPAA